MANRCSDCGAEIIEAAAYCHACGCRLARAEALPDGDAVAASNGLVPPARDVAAEEEQVQRAELPQAAERAEQLWVGHYSHRAVLPAWIVLALITLVIGGICMPWVGLWQALFIMLVCAVISFGGVGLYLAYRRLNVYYELTSRQFVRKTGFLTRRITRIDVINIDDIAFGQGPIERWLGVGTIQLTPGDRARPELLLPGIADVAAVATKIDDARRTERRRQGFFIDVAKPPVGTTTSNYDI